ncbi:MAG: hypothetical protein SCJ93_13075 [Bacillota bacterium]|nr:hypothetical protein [Bacillota bacterium]
MLGKRKILYWTLVTVLILSLIPMSIFAQGGNEDSGGSSNAEEKPYIKITTFKPKEETEYKWTLDGEFTDWEVVDIIYSTNLIVEGEREKIKDELNIEVQAELSIGAADKLMVQLGYSEEVEEGTDFIVVKEFDSIPYIIMETDEDEGIQTVGIDFSCEDLKREYFDEIDKFRLLVPYLISNGKTGYEFDTKTLVLEEHETYAYTQVESDIVDIVTTYGGVCVPDVDEWLMFEDEIPLGIQENFSIEMEIQSGEPELLEGRMVNFTAYAYLENDETYTVRYDDVLAELNVEIPLLNSESALGKTGEEHGNSDNPGQGNQGETGNDDPRQSDEGEIGNDDPGQGDEGETGNDDPGQGDEGNQGEENNSFEEFIEDEIIPQGMVGLFGLWLPPTEDNFILDKSCSQIRFWVMEQLMYPEIWIFEEEDIELTTGGGIHFNSGPVLEIGTSELKTSTGNGKHSKNNIKNGEGGYYKYNLKGRNCPTLIEGRYILMIMNDDKPVYFSEGVPAMLNFRVLESIQTDIKYRNQTDNTDARRTNIGSNR